MKMLLKGGSVVNVFTGEIETANVLVEDEMIIGIGDYTEQDADVCEDIHGCWLCPGLIDGHIHIESTMLLPAEFAGVCVPHGTTTVVADPHEIANVCGQLGIRYMLEASEGLPLTMYFVLPSCVPATKFDESGARLGAAELREFYAHPRVLGLGEVMDYMGVVHRDEALMEKIRYAKEAGGVINGHAPMLHGKPLDAYLAAGIGDDHECATLSEAQERIRKGQRIMIRQGTAARNLEALLPLFDEKWAHRCLLVTDDKHPADLLRHGHIDNIIRMAAAAGKNPVTGIRMATLWAAEYFGLRGRGAVAPGYRADILVLEDLNTMRIRTVYCGGKKAAEQNRMLPFTMPRVRRDLQKAVRNSFYTPAFLEQDFQIEPKGSAACRVIETVKGQLITHAKTMEIDFAHHNGIDRKRDILKIAVLERHLNTGHKGLGFIRGIGLKSGAIASSVSHDSHNIIVIGENEKDMAFAANWVRREGGCVVVRDETVIAKMPLPVAGLMSDLTAEEVAAQNEALREGVLQLGAAPDVEAFMTMAFVSLPVIPHLKITTLGLIDVDRQQPVSLFADGENEEKTR